MPHRPFKTPEPNGHVDDVADIPTGEFKIAVNQLQKAEEERKEEEDRRSKTASYKLGGIIAGFLAAGGLGTGVAYSKGDSTDTKVKVQLAHQDERIKKNEENIVRVETKVDAGLEEVRKVVRKVDQLDNKIDLLLDQAGVPKSKRPK